MHGLLYFLSFFMYIRSADLVANNSTFKYFGYGSNLLMKRIHIQNPTAVFDQIAKLENYRLDFNLFSKIWNGAVSTIIEEPEAEVWGTLWTIDLDQVQNLDDQEGVNTGWYFAKNVTVTTVQGEQVLARTYEMVNKPNKSQKHQDLPQERRPSSTYLAAITIGAVESKLPAHYIASLFKFPSNGQLASPERRKELGYPF